MFTMKTFAFPHQAVTACLAMLLLSSQIRAESWAAGNEYRIEVTVEADTNVNPQTPAGVYIDFAELLKEHGIERRVDPASVRVIRGLSARPEGVQSNNVSENEVIAHQLTGDFFNLDAGWVWWRLRDRHERRFHIYFDTTDGPTRERTAPTALVGVGDPLRYNDGLPGFAGSVGLHSTFWPVDFDGDGKLDLVGFALRNYEHGAEPEKELGNAVYYYKNMGMPGKPLYKAPTRVMAADGEYLTSPYLYQNFFPSDWDGDGDTDFFGFRGNTLDLYENTGERDRNGLMLLKQPVPIAELLVSDYREYDPNPLGKRHWALRGARYVDWDGDGDRDLIVSMRTVNQVGTEDSSKGIIPYGNGLVIFEVFENTAGTPDAPPVFAKPFVLREERGLVISAFGPAPGGVEYLDWDSDGDHDLIFHDLTNRPLEGGRIMFCENIGTRAQPLFVMPIPILEAQGSPIVCDWNRDGRFDLIACGEYFENINPDSGDPSKVMPRGPLGTYIPRPGSFPRFVSHGLAQQVDPLLHTYFAVAVDWDGDGELDLIGGYQSGVRVYRNMGTTTEPVFDRGRVLHAGDEPIAMHNWHDPQADPPIHWGPQGPGEPRHGWANPSVADWDNDGDLDLFLTGQRWQILYFENTGTRIEPVLATGREVQCNGDPQAFSWRSKVSLGDLDGDGRMELVVTSHADNVFTAYRQTTEQTDPGVLQLEQGFKLMQSGGESVKGWYGGQNNNGDNHSQLVDWDGDGDLDLLNGSLWGLWYYENTGTLTSPVFKPHGKVQAAGKILHTFNHAGSFDAADWTGDGRPDLLVGAECPSDQPFGSRLYLFERSYLENKLPVCTLGRFERR